MSGYIGTQPVPQATQTRQTFTATASQTSFATGGYQAGYLDVFLNGVKLVDGTDYTATNGSDVVLTTGAASGDTLEVVAYTAFEAANVTGATDFTVTGSFTSQGIDDNATSTAMTLDASGNLLVGTTDTSLYNNTSGGGFHASPNGFTEVAYESANAADPAFLVNNTGADGDIIQFRKDGSTVGSIGVENTYLTIGKDDTNLKFHNAVDAIIPHNGTSNRDAAIDLGYSSGGRFKDLYLSGGVYLGGTGSANKLDDYEEGTWTPTIASGGSAAPIQARYTKIGKLVTCFCYAAFTPTNNTSVFYIGGLPFTKAVDSNYFGSGHTVVYSGGLPTSAWGGPLITGGNLIYFHNLSNGSQIINNVFGGNQHPLMFSFTYITT